MPDDLSPLRRGLNAADFHRLRVLRSERLTPGMLRLVLGGDSLRRFRLMARTPGPYLKLLLPLPGQAQPPWPSLAADGGIVWPGGAQRPPVRTYSLRRFDAQAGELCIDFVLHGDDGIAARWAVRAQPGDLLGVYGPSGRMLDFEPDYFLLAGDHTALPAIAQILETLPPDAVGQALIEVPGAADEQLLIHPAGMRLSWLHARNDAGATPLQRAVSALPPPSARAYAWGGAEARTARAIRADLRLRWALRPEQLYILNYWRRGTAEGGFRYSE